MLLIRPKKNYQEFFQNNGYVVLKNVVPKNLLQELPTRIDQLDCQPGDECHNIFRHKHVFNRNPWWLSWIDLPIVCDLAESVLGQDCHIIGQSAWRCSPGYHGCPCHIDYIPHTLTPEQTNVFCWPSFICTAHFFPHHLTEEIGPTKVIPGSHRFGGRYEQLDQYVSIFPEPGDCLFFRSDLLHGGGVNKSTESRYLLQVHYSQRWIAQRWAQPNWQWNSEILQSANPRQLRLLGQHPKSNYD